MKFYTTVERLGDYILCIYYENGKRIKEKIQYQPTLYMYSDKPSEYKDIRGRYLLPKKFNSMREATDFINSSKSISNFYYCGMETYQYQFTSEFFPGKIEFDHNLIKIGYLDIETRFDPGVFPDPWKSEKEITALTLILGKKTLVFGTKTYLPQNKNERYFQFKDEKSMLVAFVTTWASLDMDIVCGWNSEYFDIPYLINRILKILGQSWVNKLSPWGKVKKKTFTTVNNKETESYEIYGLSHLDYMQVFIKFGKDKFENNKLDTVASELLGERKIDYVSLGYKDLNDLYERNPQLFFEYNIKDTELLPRIEKKTRLLQLVMMLAYDMKVNYIETFRQTRMWDSYIYDYLKQKNIIVPQKPNSFKNEQFLGAYVKDPKPGVYEWVVTFDVSSLYPSLYMTYNIGPDTYIGTLREGGTEDFLESLLREDKNPYKSQNKAVSMAANGTLYRKDIKGFFPEILEKESSNRKVFKDIQINSEKKKVLIEDELKRRGIKVK